MNLCSLLLIKGQDHESSCDSVPALSASEYHTGLCFMKQARETTRFTVNSLPLSLSLLFYVFIIIKKLDFSVLYVVNNE